jgi:N-acetylmuramic acid 6-phosphate etherase
MQTNDTASLGELPTESRNPRSEHLDQLSTLDMLRLINDEDATVATAVRAELPSIAHAVDEIAARFNRGGRLFYIGAGTSGRLGVLDASECPPTFSVPAELVQGLIAGGDSALRLSSEHSEDSPELGAQDLAATDFGRPPSSPSPQSSGPGTLGPGPLDPGPCVDTLVGIAASGRTPYVLGAIAHAKQRGALTIGLSCVPGSPLAQAAEIAISPATGPEVLTGSTRLKAGTATKLVLNMISTGVMVRTGATFGNLMVNVRPTNAKLVDRAERIIAAATGVDRNRAAQLLRDSGDDVKTAIVMGRLHLDAAAARSKLAAASGILAHALG